MNYPVLIAATLLSYLIGSLSCAIIVCKVLGKGDPRTQGSKNPGATNVMRIAGKIPAAIVLIGDALKGWLPVFVIQFIDPDPIVVSAVFFAAVVGHLFPIYFRFKGGKGVATYLGGVLAISPLLGGIFIATWLGIFAISRISSLSAIIAMISMPIWAWYGLDKPYAIILGILALLIIIRHRENVMRLLQGKESKFKTK